MQPGRILVGRYRLVRTLGSGAHGTVWLGEDLGRGGRDVAVKVVEGLLGRTAVDPAERLLAWFRHPNWADVLESGRCGEHDWFQVLRFVPGTSLDRLAGPQSPDFVWRFLEDGARVLRALHRQGLIHYDVTPGNFLKEETGEGPRFVLTDGGLAHVGPLTGVARGTPLFMAPELTEDRSHDHRADLYSLGLVAFRLATGRDPLEGGAGEVLGRRRREPSPRASTLRPDLPPALDDLIADLLARDPSGRPVDGGAVLQRIASGLGREVPDVLPGEAFAAASAGEMVDRLPQLDRFRRTLAALGTHAPERAERPNGRRTAPITDAVLLLTGPSGAGTTRLCREMRAIARDEEVPVLLLAGRDGAPDPNDPLRRLLEGIQALAGLDPRTSERKETDDGLHAEQRAIEHLLRTIEAAARARPFLLCVEDAGDLPPAAQEAVRVLARHLLAQTEHCPGPSQPPVVLVIDVGAGDPTHYQIPDAADPRAPILPVGPLSRDEVRHLCASRFPGLRLTPDDLEAIERASRGMPGMLVALMAEGCRRGDLRCDTGRWTWQMDGLDGYAVELGLTPVQQDALHRAGPGLREFLEHVCLAKNPLPAAVAAVLVRSNGSHVTESPLLVTVQQGGGTCHAPASLAVRQVLLRTLDATTLDERRRTLLSALDRVADPATLLDRARLRIDLGFAREALTLLQTDGSDRTPDERMRMQRLLRDAVTCDATLLNDPATRTGLIDLLHQGSDATDVALRLAATATPEAKDLATNLRLTGALERVQRTAEANALLLAQQTDSASPPHAVASLHVARARTLLALGKPQDARKYHDAARSVLRSMHRSKRDHVALVAQHLLVDAQIHFAARPQRSRRSLRLAGRAARRARLWALHAQILNNEGIVWKHEARNERAIQAFRRSLRLKRALGDIRGIVLTTINLAEVLTWTKRDQRSAVLYLDAISISLRHGYPALVVEAQRRLATLYDLKDSCRLALDTLLRALRTARVCSLGDLAGRIAPDVAALAASLGEAPVCANALLTSALTARAASRAAGRARHYLGAAIAALHLGQDSRAKVYLKRVSKRRIALTPADRRTIDLLGPLYDALSGRSPALRNDSGGRPAPGSGYRDIYRGSIILCRAFLSQERQHRTQLPAPRIKIGPAQAGRLLIEHLLLASSTTGSGTLVDLIVQLEPRLGRSDHVMLHARCLAALATHKREYSPAARAQLFSQSVALVSQALHNAPPRQHVVPRELLDAAACLAANSDARAPRGTTLVALQALAHHLLITTRAMATGDQRQSAALRKVLDAASGLRAGGGVDRLLESMTRHAIEVTRAQRACVVLLEHGSDINIRLATSASQQNARVDVADLSHTVIRRVLASKEPLLLHDVFDDAELLGRPSILSMSLRSILCVPMLRDGTLYGVMYADTTSAAAAFDRVDLEVLSLFAEQAAAALGAARLVEDLQKSYAELKSLQERLVRGERLRVIGELSSGVAHEFNNLLTSILARVQMMSLGLLSTEMRRDLDLIEKAALDAAGVVRRLQSFSRQQRQGDFTRVNMRDICLDAVDFLRPLWRGKHRTEQANINVQVHAEPDLWVRGDATQLREVLTNVIKNSIDALPHGGSITITAARRDGKIRVRVHDTGVGIPADQVVRVFDPFFTTKGDKGTGLGLCLSQQITERHGGLLTIESRLGEGTVVSLTLPIAGAADEYVARSKPDVPAGGAASLCVVVVDDDANVLRPLCTYLQRAGFEVVSASDGAEGLRAVRERAPDVVLSDIGMPGMDGIELCRQVQQLSPAVPIVLMSGWASDVDPIAVREAGARALLAKPFAMQQVTELLASVARRRGTSQK